MLSLLNSKFELQCRLCGNFKNSLELLHVENAKSIELNLEYKISQCLPIEFSNAYLPKHVCLHCCEKVSSTYDFRQDVIKAQEVLKPIITDTRSIKSEISNVFIRNDPGENCSDAEDEKLDGDDDSDFGKPLSVIKVEVELSAKRKSKVKSARRSKVKSLEDASPEKVLKAAERSEFMKKIKDEWKSYKWKCSVCLEILLNVEELRIHFKDIHNETTRYSCMECVKIYEGYDSFKRHVATHRNKFKYQCDICQKYFHRSKHYKNHVETHSPEKKFMCSQCGKYYKTTNSLRSHLKTHIPIIEPKFECNICHKKVNSRTALLYHEKIHNGKRDYTCEHCGKNFLVLSALKYHMKLKHSDEKPFCCQICNKLFKTSILLGTHQQVHSTNRKFACETCGKRFHRKETLIRHSTVHTGILAFPCESCSKRFRTKQLLKVHTRQHTGERPYACEECNHRFVDSSNYIKHMKAKHGVMSIRKNVEYKVDPINIHQSTQKDIKPLINGGYLPIIPTAINY